MPPTVEELQAEIEKLRKQIEETSKRADEELEEHHEDRMVPYSRLSDTRRQLKIQQEAFEALRTNVDATLAGLKNDHAKALKKAEETYEAQVATARADAGHDLALSDLGVKDPTMRRLLREHHASLDEATRKAAPGPADWLKARRAEVEAAKGDPKKAPAPIPWLDAYEGAISGAPEQRRERAPRINEGAGPKKADGYSAEDLDALDGASLLAAAGWTKSKPGA